MCTARPWDTAPSSPPPATSPQTLAARPRSTRAVSPRPLVGTGSCPLPPWPAHQAGVTALAGKVIQALALQLLSDQCDHGRDPCPLSAPMGTGVQNSRLQEAWAAAGSERSLKGDFRFTEERTISEDSSELCVCVCGKEKEVSTCRTTGSVSGHMRRTLCRMCLLPRPDEELLLYDSSRGLRETVLEQCSG